MTDTRETLVSRMTAFLVAGADNEIGNDIPEAQRPAPRFRAGDVLAHPLSEYPQTLREDPRWDREFRGWVVCPGVIAIHESNFVPYNERDLWDPHAEGLWSWWTRRTPDVATMCRPKSPYADPAADGLD